MNDDVMDISDDSDHEEQDEPQPYIDRRAVLAPVITRVVDALGGYEGDVYQLGDEAYGCLKDLKKLWRKDDTDDERTVARIFWETRVLPNDLIPILLTTAGKGMVEDKRAVACVDLMTAMTWPIDMAEELKELDDELDKGTDYTQLLQSHLHYKVALLRPGVIQAMFGIMLPPLAKGLKERVERDGQIINVVLHLIRNLAFIKDLPANTHRSSDQAELSSLQSKLIRTLEETHTLQLLLTIAANTDNDPLFNGWNSLVLEIFYLLFRGVKPWSLAQDQTKQPAANLQRLLAMEERNRREVTRKATSRHSRFGTTIAVKLNPNKKSKPTDEGGNEADSGRPTATRSFVLHRQQAIHGEAGTIMDITKRQKTKKGTTTDELARDDNISTEARLVLQNLANEFLEDCFNPFLSGLLKDIRSERAKITEKDNLRLLYVTKWFLEYFLSMRGKAKSTTHEEKWNFGLIAEVTERVWIVWVLKRMREAVEEKPKLWTELQAGIECLTQLLLLIDKMSSSEITDPTLSEAAEVLQQQLIYNGEVLDIALESLRTYKEGTQSLAYLDSSVHLAYALLRMLERWGKEQGDGTYVRKKTAKRKRGRKPIGEEDGIPDVEDVPDEEEIVHETLFTFDAFEMKFANSDVANTLLTYLGRHKEFTSSENMKRVVSLMHRQAVKAKAEGIFFKASTLDLFKTVLADQKSFPQEQAYKDLVNLINFILRRFFKAVEEQPSLAIEVFFPKNRGHWKQYSSWEPEEKPKKEKKSLQDSRFPADVEVKKGYSWSDQLGIAIAALVNANQKGLVTWTQNILTFVIDKRSRIINDVDHKSDTEQEDNDVAEAIHSKGPSAEALGKISDEMIPYLNTDQADAATKNPNLKLLFRLSKFYIRDEDADELEWYIPAAILPSNLERTLTIIVQFLETPFDLNGKKVSEVLRKKRRRRRRRSPSRSSEDDAELSDPPERKKKKKEKEKQLYKSAQFIEDSDAEYGDMDAFLEKERLMREKASLAASSLGTDRPVGMRATGTKKRRRNDADSESKGKKKRVASPISGDADSNEKNSSDETGSDGAPSAANKRVAEDSASPSSSAQPAARPRPRPIVKPRPVSPLSSSHAEPVSDAPPSPSADKEDGDSDSRSIKAAPSHRVRKHLVISDDEDE